MRKLALTISFGAVAIAALLAAPASQARLSRPGLESPTNGASVQSIPAFTWHGVRGAAQYEFELSADPRFRSIALGSGFGTGAFRTHVTAATIDKSVPDGTYYWRVRGITASDGSGAWSPTRRIFKAWRSRRRSLAPTPAV
jgi:hypothetical protein